ncbi:MAG: heme NO-binding domain-containing protein [Planctomycetota bacterium]
MKGMIFTEFIDFVEEQFGLDVVDEMIDASGSDGVYTSVGTYAHDEIVQMLLVLSKRTQIEIPELLKVFGRHLFKYLAGSYPAVIGDTRDGFTLLSQIDNHIHVEVRKLYPDSELPRFTYEMASDDQMTLVYRSERALADLAEGLLFGCFEHFGQNVDINREDLSDGQCRHVKFDIRKIA